MTQPDFILIGAMKCGTSTLAAQLGAQAGVFMTTPKEPNYFSDDDVFARGEDWYRGLFAAAPAGALKGEASTHYTKLPTLPQALPRMRAMLDAPKLIYMIRNPVTRAVSHHIHEWSEERAPGDTRSAFARMPELVDYGRYAMQIAPYIDAYGAGAICLTSLERLTATPQEELARIGAFLGLAEPPVWTEEKARQNVSSERFRRLPGQKILVDNPVARALRHALVPKSFRTWVRQKRSMTRRPSLPDGLRRELEAEFLEDRAELARLFPGHAALTDCYPFA